MSETDNIISSSLLKCPLSIFFFAGRQFGSLVWRVHSLSLSYRLAALKSPAFIIPRAGRCGTDSLFCDFWIFFFFQFYALNLPKSSIFFHLPPQNISKNFQVSKLRIKVLHPHLGFDTKPLEFIFHLRMTSESFFSFYCERFSINCKISKLLFLVKFLWNRFPALDLHLYFFLFFRMFRNCEFVTKKNWFASVNCLSHFEVYSEVGTTTKCLKQLLLVPLPWISEVTITTSATFSKVVKPLPYIFAFIKLYPSNYCLSAYYTSN